MYAEDKTDLIKNARSGVLMDSSSGKILFEKDKDERVAPASMTKMVAQILILENIENGAATICESRLMGLLMQRFTSFSWL